MIYMKIKKKTFLSTNLQKSLSVCLVVAHISREPFILLASHLACLLLRPRKRSVKLGAI